MKSSQPQPTMTMAASLAAELIESISSDNRANGRRACTRVLNQWKKVLLPKLSKEESLALLSILTLTNSDDDENAATRIGIGIVPTLLAIINNDEDFSTEGHRETSVEILKALLRIAFETHNNSIGDALHEVDQTDGTQEQEENNDERIQMQTMLIKLLEQCSHTFQKRMARHCQTSNKDKDSFVHHGTMTEPMESSEHIRLLLVDLMTDLGGYCLSFASKNNSISSKQDDDDDESETTTTTDKLIIEATSSICHTLAKSTFLDPYPEVQRGACNLVIMLTQLCPLAVRMNVTSLLVPLTGKVGNGSNSTTILPKKCLFRHRHAKTRCRAVDASAAIVLCCLRENSGCNNDRHDSTSNCNDSTQSDDMQPPAMTPNHLSKYGSKSTSMEQILQDTILPGWEDLLKSDPSASVQIAVLKTLGNDVAKVLDWRYSPANSSNIMSLASMVEARILTMFLTGISVGNVNQVRSMAVQQLNCLQQRAGGEGALVNNQNATKEQNNLQRDILLAAYFQPMMELILNSCSQQDWAPIQSKVRLLETLQVILSIAIPLMEKNASPTEIASSPNSPPCSVVSKVELTNTMIGSIMNVLSKNILDEEKDVLEAALACCRILGSNSLSAQVVSEVTLMQACKNGDNQSVVAAADEDMRSNSTLSSPRQVTFLLLTLDGMMKGSLCNKEAISILHEIDPTLDIPTVDWFHSSPSSVMIISSLLCHPIVTSNVATSSSLAWALVDACNSFVQCVQQSNRADGDKWELKEEVVVNILISIAYLLGCPSEYGLSSHAMSTLDSFSSFQFSGAYGSGDTDEHSNGIESLMDAHFREVLPRIVSSASAFPWKQTDPAFIAVDALLRACSGSTVGGNFDLVAPFFISHLSTAAFNKNDQGSDSAHDQSLKAQPTTKDELAEEYSLRISLMALLQSILSDESFSQTLSPQQREFVSTTSTFSAQFTTDVLLSLVLPNLVWKAGGMASALRKLAAATLFSLLSHCGNKKEALDEKSSALLHPNTAMHLIPVLHSNLEDTEATTREISCVCLSLVLKQISTETFTTIWEMNTRVIDNMYPRLLELLDDSHDPIRMAACNTLGVFLTLVHSAASESSFNLGLSSLENITTCLLIQLDDPDHGIQEHVFQVLLVLLEVHHHDNNSTCCEKSKEVIDMVERLINVSLKSHRDGSYCRLLLEKVQEK